MKYKKVLSIIAFILVISALATALISDFVIFKDAIFTFVTSIIATALLFVLFCILMVISCMLIFGVFLLEQNGFWPMNMAMQEFHNMISEITITTDQINTFRSIRIVLIIICITTFVLSIIALHKGKDKKAPLKGMSVVTLIFSILGVLTALALLAITSQLV